MKFLRIIREAVGTVGEVLGLVKTVKDMNNPEPDPPPRTKPSPVRRPCDDFAAPVRKGRK